MKQIAVVIVNWKTPKLTVDTIDSLNKINTSGFKYHVYLIENGSPDDSLKIFKQEYRNNSLVTLIPLKDNQGYAGGNNHGIKAAFIKSPDFVLLLNNDVILDPMFLSNLLKSFKKHKNIGLIGPKIYFAPGFEYHKSRYSQKDLGHVIWSVGSEMDWNNVYGKNLGIDTVDHGQFNEFRSDLESTTGCCLLISTDVFRKVGFLSTDYFMYYEDNDFCQKVKTAGFLIAYEPTAVIWHLNSGSSGAGGGPLHDYFLTRNRLIFGFRYASLRTKFALIRDSCRTLFIGTSWQKRGVIDYYLHKFGKGSWQ